MKTIVCAFAGVLIAFGFSVTASADVGPFDPPGWYLEGPGVRAGPFGSPGLCMDLRNRQGAAAQCVHYDRYYWLVIDTGTGATASLTASPFGNLQECLMARTRIPVAYGRSTMCTRRSPDSRPLPGTASLPSVSVATLTR